jgi:3-deoxy-manno-octulosonate cytidylyltransferase (CMP-KDO synthetase)
MKKAVVIPARLASTRLPRKALRDVHGKPVIQWVYERSKKSKLIDDVFVATPDEELKQVVENFGGKVILTGPASTVLDRCSMAADNLIRYKNIIVVQGDEPTIYPEMIDLVADKKNQICLIKEISREEAGNPNTVKALIDNDKYFIYLSRSVIPGSSPEKDYRGFIPKYYKQVCVMKFDTPVLRKFKDWKMSQIERSEGIDLLRFIERGIKIKSIETNYKTQAVDTIEDLEKVRRLLK